MLNKQPAKWRKRSLRRPALLYVALADIAIARATGFAADVAPPRMDINRRRIPHSPSANPHKSRRNCQTQFRIPRWAPLRPCRVLLRRTITIIITTITIFLQVRMAVTRERLSSPRAKSGYGRLLRNAGT